MKILSLAFCFLLLAVSVNSIAQSSRSKKEISHPIKNNWWVQISPLTLLEPETIVSASIQYNPIPSLGIVLDGGMYIARQSYDDNGFFPYSGFRLKPQVKYYFDTRKREKLGFYISLQGLIKRTTRNRQDWFSRGSNGGQVVFNQLIDYKERKLVLGGNFITGLEFLLGAKKRWMTEIYLGIGVRNKSFSADNLPADVSIDYELGNDRGAFIDLFQNGVFPTVTAGFKVGYRIK